MFGCFVLLCAIYNYFEKYDEHFHFGELECKNICKTDSSMKHKENTPSMKHESYHMITHSSGGIISPINSLKSLSCRLFASHPLLKGTELIPNLYNFVRDTVDDVIADLIVVPNMVAVPIAPWPPGIQSDIVATYQTDFAIAPTLEF